VPADHRTEGVPAFQVGEPLEGWPFKTSLPLARADISTVELDDNVAIYDDQGRVLVLLNSTAHAVLERSDGRTPFEQIVLDLADLYDEQLDLIADDVGKTLRKLVSMGLVADAAT
jgi:Coenzyme PQQ synthesis protein D (PqqD)